MLISILEALIALPKIAGYVMSAVQQIVSWYVEKQTAQALAEIADAAAFAARAQTEEERYAAAEKWRQALSHPRVS